jgi:hypothetical protein
MSIFLIITGIGFFFLLASLLLGDLFHHFDVDVSPGDIGTDGPALIDSRIISIFLTAFGAFGAIGMQLNLGAAISSLLGLAGGIVLGGIVYYFGRLLYEQQASSSISTRQLIGRLAEVTVVIRPNAIGQVSCRVGEERIEKLARSTGDAEIKTGSVVLIEDVANDALIVSPYDGP